MSRETRDKAEAQQRAERAKVYAEKFLQFAKPDSEYTDPAWQLAQLKGFAEKCAPQK